LVSGATLVVAAHLTSAAQTGLQEPGSGQAILISDIRKTVKQTLLTSKVSVAHSNPNPNCTCAMIAFL